MSTPAFVYPIELDAEQIRDVLPHRGEMLMVRRLTVLAHNHYIGAAVWAGDGPILSGHFPGMPVVPGVLLVEAVAQVAGAGMLSGDAQAQAMGRDHVGLLAGIRKCSFRRPVRADEWVQIEVRSRQMSPNAVDLTGTVRSGADDVAQIEILVVNAPRAALEQVLRGAAPAPQP